MAKDAKNRLKNIGPSTRKLLNNTINPKKETKGIITVNRSINKIAQMIG
jgi:hypothetical protein